MTQGTSAASPDSGAATGKSPAKRGGAAAARTSTARTSSRRPAAHPRVPVGGPGGHALEQPQDHPQPGYLVQRRDEVHLGCPGVREADIDAGADQGLDKRMSTVHSPSVAIGLHHWQWVQRGVVHVQPHGFVGCRQE